MSRARKSGDAYDLEKKLEKRYDEEEENGTPQRIVEWLNKVLANIVPPCEGTTWQDIQTYLKDGVVLCTLINKLLKDSGEEEVAFKKNAKMAFVAMNNIENFNKGAEKYGVKKTALFQTTDLCDGRKSGMLNVINCLNSLGFAANNHGYMPDYQPPEAPIGEW